MRKAIEIAKMLQKSSNGTTEEDLIEWAEEIINECANSANTKDVYYDELDDDEWGKEVDRKSILRVKEQLK